MKTTIIHLVLYTILLSIIGCSYEKLTEEEFSLLWQEYITKEFIESFDEEQSTHQRQRIMNTILQKYKIDPHTFYSYCKEKHPHKYKIFDTNP